MYWFTIDIAAPLEAVFDELSNVERHPTWANPPGPDDDGAGRR
jgi:uncharacterized protein YndB with AHSA1/START domain